MNSSGKTLSNGTLSLRFMQNANRAKQQAAIDAEQAKVKDDAEWEVPSEIRKSWGPASTPESRAGQSVTVETSYLPFLFPPPQSGSRTPEEGNSNDPSASAAAVGLKPNGRRRFNKGKEISDPAVVNESDASRLEVVRDVPTSTHGKGREMTRPGVLAKGKATALRMKDSIDGGNAPKPKPILPENAPRRVAPVPVLKMITGESAQGVGMDMRTSRKPPLESGIAKESHSFLRPAGVDSPSTTIKSKATKRNRSEDSPLLEAFTSVLNPASSDDEEERGLQKKKRKQKNTRR